MSARKPASSEFKSRLQQTPIAIIGMACLFPQAGNLREYWSNIVNGVDSIEDVPASRWDIKDYYDPDPKAPDKTYCKRGGFIPDIDFDPMEFGMPPNILEVTDNSQLLSLVVAKAVLADAGYEDPSSFDRDRIGIVLGAAGGQKLISPLNARLQYPVWKKVLRSSGISEEDADRIIEKAKKAYVPWEENSFPGVLGNVIPGRVTNRLDLGGINCTSDAACASSLAALRLAISELLEYRSDMMITGGVDMDNSVYAYISFSKTPALTTDEQCKPFDSESKGMLLGEGVGMVVLKRLEDAERDKDRIYAVIRGIGTSSDGRFKSIYNPRPEGQAKALRRAYEDAGFPPSTVGLVEAHGTGTGAGDPAEVTAIREVFSQGNPRKQYIALGSVKSQIGHTKAAAGVASFIKAVLALHHKVLPPTINVTKPNPKFDLENSPFYLNTETRPWINSDNGFPRRASVSSFGFGGTNYHVVLEEYHKTPATSYRLNTVPDSIILSAVTPDELIEKSKDLLEKLKSEDNKKHYRDLLETCQAQDIPAEKARVGFVSESLTETCELLQIALNMLQTKREEESWDLPQKVHYRRNAMDLKGKVVALFSGQGSQYLDMGKDLTYNFPPIMDAYRETDHLFVEDGCTPLSQRVFPKPVFDPVQRTRDEEQLQRTEHAQPAIGVFSLGLYKILEQAGFCPDFVAGHSFGELTALWAAKVLSDTDFLKLAKARGKAMAAPNEAGFDAGTMLAVIGDVQKIKTDLKAFSAVTIANLNSRQEVVIAGPTKDMTALRKPLEDKGFRVIPLSVSAAFHTALVEHAQKPFAQALQAVNFQSPRCPVYSNTTGKQHPSDPTKIRKRLEQHLLNPVLFKEEIENIYDKGGRLFVEFGPKGILAKLVGNILEGKPHLAVALNATPKKGSDRQLREAVVQLRVAGLPLQDIDPYHQDPLPEEKKPSVATVKLNGANYVSEKTRQAFVDALNDGFKVKQAISPVEVPSVSQTDRSKAAPTRPTISSSQPQQASVDSPRVLQSIEQSLALFYKHQSEGLQVHEQYLNNSMEYAQSFYDLMRQQQALLADGSVTSIPESVERSMGMFHSHQGETLRAHDQYLRNQVEVSKSALEVIKDQASLLSGASLSQVRIESRAARPVISPAPAPTRLSPEPVPQRLAEPAPRPDQPLPVSAPAVVQAMPATPAPTGPSLEDLTQMMLQVVSEKTGYPVEMLDLDMEVEADLGIDSIKRVEIMGTMMETYPDLPELNPEELAELRTLRQIVEYMQTHLPQAGSTVQSAPLTPTVAPGPSMETVTQTMLQVVSEKTGYPVEMLDLDMEVEADLGIDSIKRVEIMGTMMETYPDLPELNPEELAELRTLRQIVDYIQTHLPQAGAVVTVAPVTHPSAAGPSLETITQTMLQVVSEKTGYPVEMLDLDMEVEADLGIDSIKRVEIMGTMMETYPDLPELNPEELAELRTLRQIVEYMQSHLAGAAPDVAAEAPVASDESGDASASGKIPLGTPLAKGDSGGFDAPSNVDAFAQRILQVVSERTGYPVEMLELDMQMETELGIDRVKLIEILGQIREQHAVSGEINHDELTELNTLEELIIHTKKCMPSEESEGVPQPAEVEGGVAQGFARLKLLPAPDSLEFELPAHHVCLLTDDGSALTARLAQCLVKKGWKVVVLSLPPSIVTQGFQSTADIPHVVLQDLRETHLRETLKSISDKYGEIGGLLHVNPVLQPDSIDDISLSKTGKAILMNVFLLAKHLKVPLTKTSPPGRRFFITVARLNGTLGVGEGNFDVVGSGLFGLTKTLNAEWESVFCRAIDLSPDLDIDHSVSAVLQELHDPDLRIAEAGYGLQGRATLVSEHLQAAAPSAKGNRIDSSSVFLVSGGAKGVTAQCVTRLASVCKSKFLLLGRSALTGEEPAWAKGCSDEGELKRRGMEQLKSRGDKPTPVKVAELLKPILSERDISKTLAAIRQAGGEAEYISADVTDVKALRKVLPVAERFGTITGVIHGAGVLADKFIEKKTVDDFESVYSTKVKGLEALLSCVDASKLQHLILFSSAAGFFGNPGQSDYAIANEILNKAAYQFKHRHPDCHVVSFNWGPWDGGMVTDSLKKMFAERNIHVIPIDAGTKVFVDTLTKGDDSISQILVGGSMSFDGNKLDSDLRTYRVVRKLTLEDNPLLLDHIIGGKPVLPNVCADAWMRDACEQFYPGYKAFRCDDFKTLKGIVFDETLAAEYVADIKELRKDDASGEIEFAIQISSQNSGKVVPHYSARVLLVRRIPEAPIYKGFDRREVDVIDGKTLYQDGTLFHGPRFQGIERVINLSSEKLTTECRITAIKERDQGQCPTRFYSPHAADVQFQAMLVWVRKHYNAASLPLRARSSEQYRPIPIGRKFYVSLDVEKSTKTSLVANVTAHDDVGRIYRRVLGAEVTISKTLNQQFEKTTTP